MALDSDGSAGDILIMWNDLKYKCLNTFKGKTTIKETIVDICRLFESLYVDFFYSRNKYM